MLSFFFKLLLHFFPPKHHQTPKKCEIQVIFLEAGVSRSWMMQEQVQLKERLIQGGDEGTGTPT